MMKFLEARFIETASVGYTASKAGLQDSVYDRIKMCI